MLIYELPGKRQRIALTGPVLNELNRHRQVERWKKEAGGQLFARITSGIIIVAVATGPQWNDYRRRFTFIPDKSRLKAEILQYFEKGLHYIGDWHTHPQSFPLPSDMDLSSMKECFIKSKHELDNFVLIIVGKEPVFERLWVGLINNKQVIRLKIMK